MQLFNPETGLLVSTCIDLDCNTKNIDCFATFTDSKTFNITSDFNRQIWYNSSIMKWHSERMTPIIWESS